MALTRDMPIRDESRRDPEHETTYQGSRGGWVKTPPKPIPGKPKGE